MADILIVDDKEENLYYLGALLEGQGYSVEAAQHGAEALVKARQAPPSLVVSDLLMPVMDGYTLLRHWKADPRLTDIPFIVYTATYTEREDEQLALNLGADAFILKPCEPDDFLSRIIEVLSHGSPEKRTAIPEKNEEDVLKHYSETLIRKLEEKMLQLEEANRILQLEIAERRAAEAEANFKHMILKTQQDASLDAILVVGENGDILSCNQRFLELWEIPKRMIEEGHEAPLLRLAREKLDHPDAFISRIEYLYSHHDEKSHDELQFRDGRTIDRFSAPITGVDGKYYGRVWFFRDITEQRRALIELEKNESWFRSIFENANTGIASTDAAGNLTRFNEAFRAMLGFDEETLKKMNFTDLTHPEDLGKAMSYFNEVLAGKRNHYHIAKRYVANHGRIIWVDLSASVIREAEGKVTSLVAVIQDITERRKAELRITRLNRVLAVLSQINSLIVRVQKREELFAEACRIATEAGGFRMAMIAIVEDGRIVPIASAGKDEELQASIRTILSSSEGAQKTMVYQAISEKKPVISNDSTNDPRVLFGNKYAESGVNSMAIFPLLVCNEAVGMIALYSEEKEFFHEEELQLLFELTGDISFAIDHIDKQERLNYLAYYDVLTGLANRNLFLDRAGQFVRNAESGGHRLALVIFDLERFKNINDSLGRPVGDALLKQVASWLSEITGDVNLLARVGTDQFALLFPEIRQDVDAARVVEKTLAAFLDHRFMLEATEFRIGVKLGIALFPDDGDDAETLFGNAEAALKMAKKSGDRYLFHRKEMTETVATKLSLENRLRRAIETEEFVLHYQPKLNLSSRKVVAAEALIRWNDPQAGLVYPGKFIPILEETGLIREVGRWALRKAIEDYLRWRESGLSAVRISVNVSPIQLRDPGFVSDIKKKIGVHEHAAEGLELEITESMIMEDVTRAVSSLKQIHDMGVTIAIDDFGTGFSSLGYLSKLPVDALKIDRSFVNEMTARQEGLALVSTIINLAHSLKLNVVAEGVETEDQARLLRLLECDEMQGFLFSKPVPVEIFEAKFMDPRRG